MPQQTILDAVRDLKTLPAATLRRTVPPEYRSLIERPRNSSKGQKSASVHSALAATLEKIDVFAVPADRTRRAEAGKTRRKPAKSRRSKIVRKTPQRNGPKKQA
jgi:hypothetical protein